MLVFCMWIITWGIPFQRKNLWRYDFESPSNFRFFFFSEASFEQHLWFLLFGKNRIGVIRTLARQPHSFGFQHWESSWNFPRMSSPCSWFLCNSFSLCPDCMGKVLFFSFNSRIWERSILEIEGQAWKVCTVRC